jgi:translation initiation factor IF-3
MVHQEYGRKLLDRMTDELSDLAIIERSPLVEGRNMIMILSPTTKKHTRGDRPHDDRSHAAEHAPTANGTAGDQRPEPGAQPSAPAPAQAAAAATVSAASPAAAAKRSSAAARKTAAGAAPRTTTTNAAAKRREENAEDSNS